MPRTRISGVVAFAVLPLLVGGCATAEGGGAEVGPVATLAREGASIPTVAIDPRTGRSYVAWVGGSDGEFDVYLSRAEKGGTSFSAPVRVNHIPGDAAPHEQAPAQVVVGSGGEVYVLWQNNTHVEGRRFPTSDLRLAVSRDGGVSFEPTVTVNDDAGEVPSSHTFHDIVVAPDGSVVVSWIDGREQDRARAAGGHQGGMGHAGGMGHVGIGPDIRIARSTDAGRSFGNSLVVDTDPCPCCRTSAAVGPDGAIYVAWRKVFPVEEGEVRDIVVARAAPGADRFDVPVRVHEDEWVFPACPHAGPSIAFDEEGRLHVAWYTGEESRQGLWHAVSGDGGQSFGPPLPLVTGEFVPASQVALAPAPGGMWFSWEDRSQEQTRVHIGFARDGSPPPSTGRNAVEGKAPAFDALGDQALLAWLDGEAVHARWATIPP